MVLDLAAMHLIDIEPGDAPLATWRDLLASARSVHASAVTADLCLEALAFSASPSLTLDAASSLLLEGDGALLRRFLIRFSLAASSAWPSARREATPLAARLRTEAAFRFPIVVLWPPVISWIGAHAQAVLRHAPREVVDLAETYITPPAWGITLPGESDLAAIVLALVETEAAAESRSWRETDDRRRLFTLALRAARFQPGRARELLLRAARRLPSASGIARQMPAGSVRRGLPWDDEVLQEPWPDGPLDRTDEDFVHVVLGAVGADHLVRLDPALAVEIFLAAMIAAPTRRGHRLPLDERELGLHRHRGAEPPWHDFAPVASLLREAPLHGIEFVRRLVEFATSRWEERALRGAPELGVPPDARTRADLPALVLRVGGADQRFSGDVGVLNWHRGGSNAPDGVAASLMALEQWLYELEPGKLPVDDLWDRLLSWHSAAILGVLADVAMRTQGLLTGPLEPLVTCFELHHLSVERAMVTGLSSAMISWSLNYPESRVKEVREWHAQGHRGHRFDQVTLWIWIGRRFEWEALDAAAERWRVRWTLSEGSPDKRLEVAESLSLFDRANWKATTHDGQPAWEFELPQNLAARRRAISAEARRGLQRVQIPDMAWRVISRQLDAPDLDIASLFAFAREPAPNGAVDARLRCSVAAMAIVSAPNRLFACADESREAREWVLGAAAVVDPADHRHPEPEPFVMAMLPIRAQDPAWFAGIGVVEMWARNRADVELRRAVAQLAMVTAAEPLTELFRRLAQRFGVGDPDVRALTRVVLEQAERRAHELYREEANPRAFARVRKSASKAVEAFARGRTVAHGATWPAPGRVREAQPWIYDEPYLVAAFSGLFEGASRPRRDDWLIAQVAALQGIVLSRLKPRPDDMPIWESGSTPYEWDQKVSSIVAAAVVEADRADRRRQLWEPWLQLGEEHHDWSEALVDEVFRAALRDPAPPEYSMVALREVVEYGLSTLERASRVRETPFHDFGVLLGVERYTSVTVRWTEARRAVATRIVDLWERWARICVPRHWDLDAFLQLASTPAAADVRVRLLTTLASTLPERQRLRDREEDALVRFLAVCWSERSGLLGQGSQRQAFDHLLNRLVAAQNRKAMTLAYTITRGA